ncbi:hypothetical protein SpAn4DRAFT_2890 [Sporomusa ovata]|uniref:Uncharacterized protein n=1 Tax=Sporomusa ovata TaxID=2378 RepID=A0A0U1KYD0_9FIRM|nr:hypothetical protein SpAn4DRAFT_2890 [Sporomusa ovata]
MTLFKLGVDYDEKGKAASGTGYTNAIQRNIACGSGREY